MLIRKFKSGGLLYTEKFRKFQSGATFKKPLNEVLDYIRYGGGKKGPGFRNGGILYKKGGKPKIHIKKANRGKFTEYCGGKVTEACIAKGKASSNPVIRKQATFAKNARGWKH